MPDRTPNRDTPIEILLARIPLLSGLNPDEIAAIARGKAAVLLGEIRKAVGARAADVLEAVEEALTDKRLDHRDALEIRAEIEAAERALASLGETLRRMHPNLAGEVG